MASEIKYRPDIDGLRAVAVLSVLIFHAEPAFLPGGFVGVDIFFVISGYLISGILFRQFETHTFKYSKFYARRIRRIFPTLVTILIFVTIAGWFSFTAPEFELLGKHIFASGLFLQNLNLLRESGYFDVRSALKPLLHLWSLAVEEQFYIIWPILIALTSKWRAKVQFRVLLFFLITSFVMNVIRVQRYPNSAFYEIQFRLWELMFGALLILFETHRAEIDLFSSFSFMRFFDQNIRSVLGFCLCVMAFIFIDRDKRFPGFWALLPVGGATLSISAGPTSVVNKWLSKPILVWIGLISYPLYLWHWPLLSFARILAPNMVFEPIYAAIVRSFCIALSFIAAWLTYKLIEMPLRRGMTRLQSGSARLQFVLLCFLFVALGLSGKLAETKHGFPSRYAAKTIAPNLGQWPKLRDCSKSRNLRGVEWCETNHRGGSADVVVIGDSHALYFADTILKSKHFRGRPFDSMTTGGTIGFVGTATIEGGPPSVNGKRNLDAAFKWAIDHHAKTVVLVGWWPIYYSGRGMPLDPRHMKIADLRNPSETDPRIIFKTGLLRTLQMLAARSIETYFVYDVPELNFLPQENCIQRPVHLPDSRPLKTCGIPLATVLARQADYRQAVASILANFPKVRTFDPVQLLCSKGECIAKNGATLLYLDQEHISPAGDLLLARSFK